MTEGPPFSPENAFALVSLQEPWLPPETEPCSTDLLQVSQSPRGRESEALTRLRRAFAKRSISHTSCEATALDWRPLNRPYSAMRRPRSQAHQRPPEYERWSLARS